MLGTIASGIIGLLTGKAGEKVGGAVSNVAQWAAAIAALAPVFLFLRNEGDAVFVQITYRDLAFWGSLLAANVLVVVRLVHRAPPPGA